MNRSPIVPNLYSIFALSFLIFVSTLLLGCSQFDPAAQSDPTAVTIREPLPKSPCSHPPENRILLVSDSRLNLVIDVSANNASDTLRIYQSGEKIYECTAVLADELTGAGHIFTVPIDREGELFRFETEGDARVWEEMIVPSETNIYRETEERAFEYYYTFAAYTRQNGWSVGSTAVHPGYE